ncbi:MAG TPA: hypothetical protein VKH19_11530 [Gemmatimonadaceae bacterium]|nr:hypothetical protein [Gemmatimonadaceae bacterium]
MSHIAPGPSATTLSATGRGSWLTPERLPKVRNILLGATLFVALLVWVSFTLGLVPRGTHLVTKLQVIGVMTWLYALVQIVDLRFMRSRFVQRRRAGSRLPEAVEGWLFGQMIAWFGIVYYVLTDDARWFVAGMVLFLISFVVFPITQSRAD